MTPFRTVEARWFVRGGLPAAVRAWFDGLGPPVEAAARTDRYLAPTDDALGLKVREGRVEAKRRAAVVGPLAAGRAAATAEAWAKWAFALAETDLAGLGPAWVPVHKTRRQRRIEAGGGACTLELSEVVADGAPWWSVCLEADGPTPAARRAALAAGARRWLAEPSAPALPAGAARGYPAWLRGLR